MSSILDNLQIAAPCPARWADMEGDDRVRFCQQCELHVYDLTNLAPTEVEDLVRTTEGRLCGRLFRRADGTLTAKNCPVGLRARLRRRVVSVASAVAALVLFVVGLLGWRSARAGGDTRGRVLPVVFGEDEDRMVMGEVICVPPPTPTPPASTQVGTAAPSGAEGEDDPQRPGDDAPAAR